VYLKGLEKFFTAYLKSPSLKSPKA
jgi:hypothetical protein